MTYKVIVDTSTINNKGVGTFLGGREELHRFSRWADIIIPTMVIEEIENSKKKHLQSEQESFLSNTFFSLMHVNESETREFDIENVINKLRDNEDIIYTPIELTDYQTIKEMKKMSLENRAPFDKFTDKGFKDAYIYFTILKYLERIKDKQVFFFTKDDRLKEAFNNENRVISIESFDEFFKHTGEHLSDKYFLEQASNVLEENVTAESIKKKHLNRNRDWVLQISTDNNTINVIVDFNNREMIKSTSFDFSKGVEDLVSSSSFEKTHALIDNIKDYVDYFSMDQIERLIEAATTNYQINWIKTDGDVKEFFLSVYEDHPIPEIIPKEIKEAFEQTFSIVTKKDQP